MASMNPKTRLDDEKRNVPPAIRKLLEYDVKLTKSFVAFLLNLTPMRSFRTHCIFLEYSCHGVVWLAGWLAFCWIADNKDLYQMQVNMIVGLIIDIIFVAIIKAATRRRRPAVNTDIFGIGPDKFSFPSGHASRAFFVLGFFTILSPLPWFLWPPMFAWAFSVALSRLILIRHHILDVLAGVILGLFDVLVLSVVWFGPEFSAWIMRSISEDNVPGGPESA